MAGRRAGLAGERTGLFFDFARVAAALRPRWIVLENVPGLLSSNGGRDMGTVLGKLADLGYGWAYRVLDAQFWGVAQRRNRVFIVGCLGDAASAAAVLFEPEGGSGDTPAGGRAGTDVTYPLTGRVGSRRDESRDTYVAYTLRSDPGGTGQGHNTNYVTHALTGEGHDASEDGTGRGTPPVAATLNSGGNSGGFRTEPGEHLVVNARQTPVTSEIAENQRGEVRTSDISPQLTTGGGKPGQGYPAAMTPMGVRKLTPLECERLQGFPDGWTCLCGAQGVTSECTCPDSPRYKALGNAIAVPVMAWIVQRIVAVEERGSPR